jgi:hypothetical protein
MLAFSYFYSYKLAYVNEAPAARIKKNMDGSD